MTKHQTEQDNALIQGLAHAGRFVIPQESANLGGAASKLFDGFGYPASFVTALDFAILQARKHKNEGSLLIVTIDNLSMILSGYGHDITEQLMRQMSAELKDIIGADDLIERIQRDQFGIILQHTHEEEATYLAERLVSHIHQMAEGWSVGAVHITCSSACVSFPVEAAHARDALDKAYISRFQAQAAGESVHAFHLSNEQAACDRQEMELAHYLSKAIKENRLMMAFQPIIRATDGAVVHYEALLRLRSDDGKIASAGALIPIAERMGLIDIIDELVLKMVVGELLRDSQIVIAFNISNLTTRNRKWLDILAEIMANHPDIAPRMIVEITETAAQRDLSQTAYFVAEIQSYGASVALDDFGSGYTSFRQLKSLSVDMVKIDGAFIKDLVDNPDNRFFVRTLLEFTKGFGLKSVAEFVENGEIAKMLMELGVDYLQGYYFGRPDTRRAWLNEGEYSNE